MPHRDNLPQKIIEENPIVSQCYAFTEATQHFFVKDKEHPYIQTKPFNWIRGYQVGGKTLMWARWTQRWSDLDFEANAKQGLLLTGRFVIKILSHGILMSKNLLASVATKMAFRIYRMENFNRRWK